MSMRIDELTVISPSILGGEYNEAEILGSVTWLWIHSKDHRDAPLHTLPKLLLPAIKNCQFVLATENRKPVFYLSWACMDLEAEKRYIENPPVCMPEEDWLSGDRIWFLDWIAPFGHTKQMKNIIAEHIFPDSCMRALDHRGTERGLRIREYHGSNLSGSSAREWFTHNPVNFGNKLVTSN